MSVQPTDVPGKLFRQRYQRGRRLWGRKVPSALGNQRGGRAGAEGEGGRSVETAVHGLENLSGRRLSSEREEGPPEGSVTLCVTGAAAAAALRTEGREGGAEAGAPVRRLPR